jgi:hypothetical protein
MTKGNEQRKNYVNQPWKVAGSIFALLLILVGGALVIFSDQGGGWIRFSLKGIFKEVLVEREEKTEGRRVLKEIKNLESQNNQEASTGLLLIAFDNGNANVARSEAFMALGRLGRLEDVSELLNRSQWYEGNGALMMYWVAEALGEIGGEQACAALNEKFLSDSEEVVYIPGNSYYLDPLVSGIRKGQCLSDKEIKEKLRRFIRDMWAVKGIHETSLTILAKTGDKEAVDTLAKYERIKAGYPWKKKTKYPWQIPAEEGINDYRNILLDPGCPWYLKISPASRLGYQPWSKGVLLDAYFETMTLWYSSENAILYKKRDEWMKRFGEGIINARQSQWEGEYENYFERKEIEISQINESFLKEQMQSLLENLEETISK